MTVSSGGQPEAPVDGGQGVAVLGPGLDHQDADDRGEDPDGRDDEGEEDGRRRVVVPLDQVLKAE